MASEFVPLVRTLRSVDCAASFDSPQDDRERKASFDSAQDDRERKASFDFAQDDTKRGAKSIPACEQCEGAISEVRRFRAALADALDFAVQRLLQDIAANVLARELALKPVEIAAIVAQAQRRFREEEPLRVRVHPDEAQSLDALDLAVAADSQLRRGDVLIDVRGGTIDVTLGVRLDRVLAASA